MSKPHLTAALNVSAVTIYGATSPDLAGALGLSQIHLCVNFPCAPCRRRVCNYTGSSEQKPACYTTVKPEKVWVALQSLLK